MATDKDKGSFGQKNYSQMGDGHSRGHKEIKSEGSFAKDKDESWKQFAIRTKSTNKQKQSPAPTKQVAKDKATWKERVIAKGSSTQVSKTPKTHTKQVSKPKQITKSR